MYILHYDTETTGLPQRGVSIDHPSNPDVVQLGAVLDNADGKEIMRLDLILYCDRDIPEAAAKVHGITTEVSQAIGVNPAAALDCFFDMVEVANVVVGFNHVGFDNRIITGFARRVYEDPDFDPFVGKQMFDCMTLGKPLVRKKARNGGFANPKLIELHQHLFNEDFQDAHVAIADVLATRRCFWRMQEMVREEAA